MKKLKERILLYFRRKSYEIYRQKPFDAEYLDLYLFSFLVKFLCSTFSLITGFVFLNNLFDSQISFVYNLVVTISILVIVEGLKYYLTPKGFYLLFKKKFTESFIVIFISLFIYSTSIFISIRGTQQFFDNRLEFKTQTLDNSKEESIKTSDYYDSLIFIEQNKIDQITRYSIENNTYKWKTTVEQINRLESRIDNLREKSNKIESKIESEGSQIVSDQFKLESNRLYHLTNLAFLSESILFISFLFSQYYLFRSYSGSIDFWKRKKKIIA